MIMKMNTRDNIETKDDTDASFMRAKIARQEAVGSSIHFNTTGAAPAIIKN